MSPLDNPMTTDEEREVLRALLRNDFPSFIQRTFQVVSPADEYRHNWHIEAIAHHLEQCRLGRIRRLVITVPPRSLKSICTSIAFPAWLLGHNPELQIMCVSYARELSVKLQRDCRAVIGSDWYKWAFPDTRIGEKDTEIEFDTTRRGIRFATSTDGVITGRGGNVIIIDDPIKPQDAMSKSERERIKQWYANTLSTRENNKNTGIMILIMQRVHEDDLAGHILENENWTHLKLPAIAEATEEIRISDHERYHRQVGEVLHPDHESSESLSLQKERMGSFHFAAQYQQDPVSEAGGLVRRDWFRTYSELPPREQGDSVVQSWDTASKADQLNDYSVCTTWLVKGGWRRGDLYLMHVFRERLLFPALKKRVVELDGRYNPTHVVVEDKGSGIGLIQEFDNDRSVRLIGFKPEGDKITRLSNQCGKIEGGRVHIPEKAHWLGDFMTEMLGFPRSRHDDQVDSVSQFLSWLDEKGKKYFTVRELGSGKLEYDSRYPGGRRPTARA